MNTPRPTVTVSVAGDPAGASEAVLADVSLESGWFLKITTDGKTYGAVFGGPDFGTGRELRRWTSVERVFETVEGSLRARGLSHVATALVASAMAEMKS